MTADTAVQGDLLKFAPHLPGCNTPEPSLAALIYRYYAAHFQQNPSAGVNYATAYIQALEDRLAELEACIAQASALPQTLIDAYALGWLACLGWAERDDLVSDIGSPAYIAEREKMLAGLSTSTAGAEQREDLHTFLNAAAGEGLVLDEVDAADLYTAIFDGASPTLPAPVAPTGAPS